MRFAPILRIAVKYAGGHGFIALATMGSPTSSAKSYTTLCQLLDSKQIATPASRAQPSHTRASRGITCVSRGTKVLSMSSSTFSNSPNFALSARAGRFAAAVQSKIR